MTALPLALFLLAIVGLILIATQHFALRVHLRECPPKPSRYPGISILKPLCGLDDQLFTNLTTFASLDYPEYEVLLGVKSCDDLAYPIACRAQARWPNRYRVVVQRGAPGFNPKVNQLITLAAAATYDILVVSDSNIRVAENYLSEIAAHLEDPNVGLVTHPLSGPLEGGLGARMDNLHLNSSIGPGVVAAKRITGKDFVVAKSMAMRRRELVALGGFEAVKDVLAEDYVTGYRVATLLQKSVVIASTPVINVSSCRSVVEFISRYARWSVMQRKMMGTPIYCAELLLNPLLFVLGGLLTAQSKPALAAWIACCLVKAVLDGGSARQLLKNGFVWRSLWVIPIKDLLVAAAWVCGLVSDKVNWRGNRLRVLKGTTLVPAQSPASEAAEAIAVEL
jgi:ceramide glucosyltransferase